MTPRASYLVGRLDRLLRRRLGNALSRDDQVAKLRLIVETAREVWG